MLLSKRIDITRRLGRVWTVWHAERGEEVSGPVSSPSGRQQQATLVESLKYIWGGNLFPTTVNGLRFQNPLS